MIRNQSITVRLSTKEKTAFEVMAKKKGLPVSQYLRSIVLAEYNEDKKKL